MKLTRLAPILWTKDLPASIDFYCEMLGFACVGRSEGWACLQKDDVELMLSLPNAHEPFDRIQFTGSFYFRPDDVQALWKQLKDTATIVYPLEDFDYGMREFAIRDNNGYILQFGQEI
ncbi:MAG TPA: VOC family protein [Candidatus Sulfotelmatobacter sp.]|nr:VOC family protein [Candidatus Sulfotelmatobacter sp.]